MKHRLIDPNEGVRIKAGTKEKNNQSVGKKVQRNENGVVKMTKADYLALLDEKGVQNQNLSRNHDYQVMEVHLRQLAGD